MRRRRWPWMLGALALASALGGVAFAARRSEPPIDPALVVVAERTRLPIEVIDVGRISAKHVVEIESKLAGRVSEVLVREGDRVQAGDTLLRLDARDFSRAVAREQSSLDRARASASFAELDRDRKRRGAESGIASRVELELAEHAARLAKIDVAASRVALATARDRLQETRITAPIAGTILRRAIEPGEMVTPGIESSFDQHSLLTLADLSELVVELELNQIDVAQVKLDQRVTLVLDALPNDRFMARVTEIAPSAIKPAGKEREVFFVQALLDRADPRVRPGMTADCRIHIRERADVVVLPIEAVRRDGEKSFVTRLVASERGERREQSEVKLGLQNDRNVEIVSGIEPGTRVLIDPASAGANETEL